MQPDINPAFTEAIKEAARASTPEELKARGVRKVRSIGLAEVSLLIERAVNRTILERTSGVTREELEDLVEGAQAEFASQLKGLQSLADTRDVLKHHREEMQKELARLRDEIGAQHAAREAGERDNPTADTFKTPAHRSDLRTQLRACLLPLVETVVAEHGEVNPVTEGLSDALTRLLVVVEKDRDSAIEILGRKWLRDKELLERRVGKLVDHLETTEKLLGEMAHEDPGRGGLKSGFRDSQRLTGDPATREKKAQLMDSLFRKNIGDGETAK